MKVAEGRFHLGPCGLSTGKVGCETGSNELFAEGNSIQDMNRISEVAIPANASWKIVNDASDAALMDAAIAIAEQGGQRQLVQESLNRRRYDNGSKTIHAIPKDSVVINMRTDAEYEAKEWRLLPVAQYGELTVIDRNEIEDYRSLHILMRDYLKPTSRSDKPISIAAFGPPGSGKSFGIRELLFSLSEIDILEFNFSQFAKPEELADAFVQVSVSGKEAVPVAFFDEFDCDLNGVHLGWLKYCLPPMQDGKIVVNGKENVIGRAVFVFAGGTTNSFKEFARDIGATEQEKYQFAKAKGPDFVSRLAGHLDVLGVNRQKGIPDRSYVLRRALIIRRHLKARGLTGRRDERSLTGHSLDDY